MLYTAIDIHKSVFQAALLDSASGELSDARFSATREALHDWAMPLRGRVAAVAIEATTGWRWVWRELSGLGFDVRLVDPGQARALRGRTRKARTARAGAAGLRPQRFPHPGVADDLRRRADPRLPPARRARRGEALPPCPPGRARGRARSRRLRVGGEQAARQARQARRARAALGARRGRQPDSAAPAESRPCSLRAGENARRRPRPEAHDRAQDRPPRLPPPTRARGASRLSRRP